MLSSRPLSGCQSVMEHIWKFPAPYNLKFIAWLFSQDKCWTADGLQTHGLPHPAIYPFCDQEGETLQHILLGCMLAREVWEVVLWPWPGGPRPTLSWSIGGRQIKPVRETAQGLYGRCWLSSFGVFVKALTGRLTVTLHIVIIPYK
jgi:hypothetical protein